MCCCKTHKHTPTLCFSTSTILLDRVCVCVCAHAHVHTHTCGVVYVKINIVTSYKSVSINIDSELIPMCP